MIEERVVRIATSVREEAREAMAEIFAALRPAEHAGIMLFCSSRHALDRVADAVAALGGGVPIIGCTTAGEIGPGGYADRSIVALGFPASDFTLQAFCLSDLDNFDAFAAQSRVVTLLSDAAARSNGLGPQPHRAAILLIDGLSCREELIANTMQHILGDLPLVGGSAGDDGRFFATQLLFDGRFQRDSAILAILTSRWPLRPLRSYHHQPSEKIAVVTEAEPALRRAVTLNGERAATEYARLLGIDEGVLNPQIFADHPFMVKVGGQYFGRAVQRIDHDGGIVFHSAIARGLALRLGYATDRVSRLSHALAAVGKDMERIDAVLAFESAANRLEADGDAVKTLHATHRFAGFSTYGEQFRDMHVNRNLVGLAIGGPS